MLSYLLCSSILQIWYYSYRCVTTFSSQVPVGMTHLRSAGFITLSWKSHRSTSISIQLKLCFLHQWFNSFCESRLQTYAADSLYLTSKSINSSELSRWEWNHPHVATHTHTLRLGPQTPAVLVRAGTYADLQPQASWTNSATVLCSTGSLLSDLVCICIYTLPVNNRAVVVTGVTVGCMQCEAQYSVSRQ